MVKKKLMALLSCSMDCDCSDFGTSLCVEITVVLLLLQWWVRESRLPSILIDREVKFELAGGKMEKSALDVSRESQPLGHQSESHDHSH